MTALRDISYMTHSPPVPEDLSRSNRAAMVECRGFIGRIVEIAVTGISGEVESSSARCSSGPEGGRSTDLQRDRGVKGEVQRLAVVCLGHFAAFDDSAAALLSSKGRAVLQQIADSPACPGNVRSHAAAALKSLAARRV
mmetsp:Transcript_33143/g.93843  ORF Transcript_33143/g.93843 Transcript_33143/m.93843 type:complete len:139 (+) Transcript_33143:2403-2819(+)